MLNWKVNAQGDHYLYEVNRDLFQRTAADTVFARKFASNLLEDDCLHFVIGTDSGLLPRYVAKYLPRESRSRYIFLELDEVLDVLPVQALPEDDRVRICSFADFPAARARAGFGRYYFRDRLRTTLSYAAEEDFVRAYAGLREAFDISLAKYMQAVGVSACSRVFIQQQLLNAPDYLRSALELLPEFEGKDVLIVAAGPSLDQHIEWIKDNRDCFVIIAVVRVAALLEARGIRPDYYAVIDPHTPMLAVARDALLHSHGVPLIARYHAHPKVVSNWRGEVFFCGPRLPWVSDLNIPSLETAGPTVTHFAISVALAGKPHAIYIAGMDLCFGVEGSSSHCSNTSEARVGPALGRPGVQQVKTYSGHTADADIHLLTSRDTAAILGRSAAAKGIPMFNLSSSAARVDDIEYMAPDALVLDTARGSIPKIRRVDERATVAASDYLRALCGEFDTVCSVLRDSQRAMKKCKSSIEKLFDRNGVMRPKVSAKLHALDSLVETERQGLEAFLKAWGADGFLSNLTGKREEDVTREDLKDFYRQYIDAYIEAMESARSVMEKAHQKCVRRLTELDFARLSDSVNDWLNESEPLRSQNPLVAFVHNNSADYESVKLRMNSAFQDIYDKLCRFDEERCRSSISARTVIQRAFYLHERGRTAALESLVDFVEADAGETLDAGLKYLLRGMRSELAGDIEGALHEYNSLVESTTGGLLELGLLRILVLAKSESDYLLSLQVLECLEHISFSYLKYHAEVLLNLGRVREALDKLADYHERFPEDVDNLVRIVEIYHSNGFDEQAKQVVVELVKAHGDNLGVRRAKELVFTEK